MKIVVLDGQALNPGDLSWSFLDTFGAVTVYDRTPAEEVVSRIGDATIVLVNKVLLPGDVLRACPKLKLICCLSTGYNVVDIATAKELGIPVCNVPDYATEAVAQFTFGLILELCHRMGLHSDGVHQGKWTACPNFCYWETPQAELFGKTIGIIGYGRIGGAVGRIAEAFGMKVLSYSRSHQTVSMDELLANSDIVTLHCPLFPETEGLINADSIAKMKDGALLINTSRGPVIDEAAVAAALRSGKLGGAAMDVVSKEPIEADNPLLGTPNCIITPHMAWASKQARQRILDCTEASIRSFLGGNPTNVVNP